MQSTAASGGFISKWQEALVGNGKLALNPFGWRKIWTADLLLPEQVWHLGERQYQLTCKNKHSLSCKAKSYNTCLERDPLDGFCIGLCRGVLSQRNLAGLVARAVVYTQAEFQDLNTQANMYAVQVTVLEKPVASARQDTRQLMCCVLSGSLHRRIAVAQVVDSNSEPS